MHRAAYKPNQNKINGENAKDKRDIARKNFFVLRQCVKTTFLVKIFANYVPWKLRVVNGYAFPACGNRIILKKSTVSDLMFY